MDNALFELIKAFLSSGTNCINATEFNSCLEAIAKVYNEKIKD